MLKQENSTGAPGRATEIRCQVSAADIDRISDDIEKTGGMITALQEDMVPLANAAYDALKAKKAAA